MRRTFHIIRVIVVIALLLIAPTIGALVGRGYAHPRLFQHSGHEFNALRFDGPRIQYWHGEYFAAEEVIGGERYHYREVQPDWAEQYAPSKIRTRLPTGSFNRFTDDSKWGFSAHPWWPPVGTPISAQTYGPLDLPGADGQPHSMRRGPTLVVRTVMSWFVLAIAAIPWVVGIAFLALRLLRARRRAAVGHCRRCGYDLRASAGRCPECGTERGVDAAVARVAD